MEPTRASISGGNVGERRCASPGTCDLNDVRREMRAAAAIERNRARPHKIG